MSKRNKQNKRNRKSRDDSRRAAHVVASAGQNELLVRGDPVEALAARCGVPLEEIRETAAGETKEEFELVEGYRTFLASVGADMLDAAGRRVADSGDPPNAHLAILLHRRGRITLFTKGLEPLADSCGPAGAIPFTRAAIDETLAHFHEYEGQSRGGVVNAATDEAAERAVERVLRDARAFELARASLLAEGIAPTTAAVRQRVLRGVVYACLSYEAEDAGEDVSSRAVQRRLLAEAEAQATRAASQHRGGRSTVRRPTTKGRARPGRGRRNRNRWHAFHGRGARQMLPVVART